SARAAAAHGSRPEDAHLGAQDCQRSRAGGRPRGQHRAVSRAAEPEPAERLNQSGPIAPEPEIIDMARLAREMLSDALEAFIRGDAAAGREVCLRDDKVDVLHRSVFRILLTHMMEDPHTIGAGMELFLVSRNLARVAGPATTLPSG